MDARMDVIGKTLVRMLERRVRRFFRRLETGETRLAAGIDPDLLIFLLFLLLPVFGRVLRTLGEGGKDAKAGPGRGARPARDPRGRRGPHPERRPGAEARDPSDPSDRGADEARELERSGEEIWRRLLEGLAPEQTPGAAPPPPRPQVEPGTQPRAEPASAPPRPVHESVREPLRPRQPAASPSRPAPARPVVLSSQSRESRPESGLGGPELVELAERSELGELAADRSGGPQGGQGGREELGELERRPTPQLSGRRTASRSLSASSEDLRRAVLWSEILAPPVALRPSDESPWH